MLFKGKYDLEIFKKDVEFKFKGIHCDIENIIKKLPYRGDCVDEDAIQRLERRVELLQERIKTLERKLGMKDEE